MTPKRHVMDAIRIEVLNARVNIECWCDSFSDEAILGRMSEPKEFSIGETMPPHDTATAYRPNCRTGVMIVITN